MNTVVEIDEFKALKAEDEIKKRFVMGKNSPFVDVIKNIKKIASIDTNVIILGESGTGKTELAEAIHSLGGRGGKFVHLNCACIPETLFGSELFGHTQGSFTGATRSKKGKFEEARGGTLFLDEIGDMTLDSQAKILTVVEKKKFSPIGSSKQISTDVRLIVATNKDIKAGIKKNTFRKDLYHRLSQNTITIPSLRDRGEDTILLIQHYSDFYKKKFKSEAILSPDALTTLSQYTWPGNIRELENVLVQVFSINEKGVIYSGQLGLDGCDTQKETNDVSMTLEKLPFSLELATHEFKKRFLILALQKTKGNRSEAAKLLSIQRTYIFRLIKQYDLNGKI